MSARYIQRRYGDQTEGRSRSSSQVSQLETSSTRSSRCSTPSSSSSGYNRAWTSSPVARQTTVNSADTYRNWHSSSRAMTPHSSYSDALVRSSRQTRLRALSSPPSVEASQPSMYSENKDYYRGYTKSIYEREPLFTDFVRNVERGAVFNTSNLSSLKKEFQSMIQDKWGKKQVNDPSVQHDIASKAHSWRNYLGRGLEPSSVTLARKHSSRSSTPVIQPRIYIYHRSTVGY